MLMLGGPIVGNGITGSTEGLLADVSYLNYFLGFRQVSSTL